ncbi:hypothetical protein HMF8227_01468 [Saliniradius amylolyticus]|uniref:Uncharacterized protein n=1 Tax=Saliniradius amylolyticus TaxID=2183582 RepID=A0A2S2E2T1_9ALTE|nr:hypothetical protein [Saliniradius amylolyticus]AWL11943.1 hypothetical protein HMF8227_01468 [Saliniradius amylolyticus]
MEKEEFFDYLNSIGASCPVCGNVDKLGAFMQPVVDDDGNKRKVVARYSIPLEEHLGSEGYVSHLADPDFLPVDAFLAACGNCGHIIPFNPALIQKRMEKKAERISKEILEKEEKSNNEDGPHE